MVNYTCAANDKSPELHERVWQAWIKKSDQMQRQIRLRDVRSGKISTDEEAANAITKFNGMDFDGRSLTINEARPIVRRDGGVGRSADSGGGRDHGKYGGGRNRW